MAKVTKAAPEEKAKPVTTANQAVNAYDWGQEQQTGFESTRPEDFGIPFLAMLQKNSPQVDEDDSDYALKGIEGATAGMIINTATNKIVYDRSEGSFLLFVPVFHEKLWQEWKKREAGGGFIKSHNTPVILTDTKRNEKNQDELPNGNIIITTSYFSGFYLDKEQDTWVRAILPMSSTQLKKARGWLNLMQSIKINGKMPPMFSHSYAITAVGESNEKGSWAGYKIELHKALTKEDHELIVECRETLTNCLQTKQLNAPADPEAF